LSPNLATVDRGAHTSSSSSSKVPAPGPPPITPQSFGLKERSSGQLLMCQIWHQARWQTGALSMLIVANQTQASPQTDPLGEKASPKECVRRWSSLRGVEQIG
jgi:hypothetical protein